MSAQETLTSTNLKDINGSGQKFPVPICLQALGFRVNGVPVSKIRQSESGCIETATLDMFEVDGRELRVLKCWKAACVALAELESTPEGSYAVHSVTPSSRSTQNCSLGIK